MHKKLWFFAVVLLLVPGSLVAQTCDTSRADLTCSGQVDGADQVWLGHMFFGGDPSASCGFPNSIKGDLNCDGFRDATDYAILYFCVQGNPSYVACPPPDVRPLVPDPRDSFIIESRLARSGTDAGSQADTSSYLYVKVSITNKDTLTNITLPMIVQTLSGGAFATLGWPRGRTGMVGLGSNTLGGSIVAFPGANSISPDTPLVALFSNPVDFTPPLGPELPNTTRRTVFYMKFDTVLVSGCNSQFEIDSVSTPLANTIQFVDKQSRRVPVNFVKGVITVNPPGDFDADGAFTSSDVVQLLNCVFLGDCNPSCLGDVNCDGSAISADVVLGLNRVFLGSTSPPWCGS